MRTQRQAKIKFTTLLFQFLLTIVQDACIMKLMDKKIISQIVSVLQNDPAVAVGYLYGSRAHGEEGPMSDYDFGVLLSDKLSKSARFDRRIELMGELGRVLKTDKVEVISLQDVPIGLRFAVISGRLLVSKDENLRIQFELKVMRETDDELYYLKRDLKIMAEQIDEGRFFV